jgi:hypothetical protein
VWWLGEIGETQPPMQKATLNPSWLSSAQLCRLVGTYAALKLCTIEVSHRSIDNKVNALIVDVDDHRSTQYWYINMYVTFIANTMSSNYYR